MFESILRSTDAPAIYTVNDLRKQVVMYMIKHAADIYPVVKEDIRHNYTGRKVDGVRQKGPFSYISYCRALQKPGFWGDAIVLRVVSMMWSLRITVIDASTGAETRIRHDVDLLKADMVLLKGADHYSAIGTYFDIFLDTR